MSSVPLIWSPASFPVKVRLIESPCCSPKALRIRTASPSIVPVTSRVMNSP